MTDFFTAIQKMEPISLEEMDSVKLMNRTDTKFAFHEKYFAEILEKAASDYRVLEIKNIRTPSYKTLYFDTADFHLFLDHHNDRNHRYKIRIRNYVESGLFFLEVKKKVNGRTDKGRIKVSKIHEVLEQDQLQFIEKMTGERLPLVKTLWNNFNRITLVNKSAPERITIDFNLAFSNEKTEKPMDKMIIAEVKQERVNLHSPFIQILKSFGIRQTSLSKYCIGSLYCYPGLKYNNFKSKLLTIQKIKKAA